MKRTLPFAIAALASAFLGLGQAQAQSCGLLADPNRPECKGGTSAPHKRQSADISAPRNATAQQDGGLGQAPGSGQKVCAFFDVQSNKCLTTRPDTQAYDSAVQTGIEAAMMGMQIQQDGLHRAKQMGVMGVMGSMGAVGVPPTLGATSQASPATPSNLLQGSAQPSRTDQRAGGQDDFLACARRQAAQIARQTGRPVTGEEMASALKACDAP